MRLHTGQVSTTAGLDVGYRYACNINDNDLNPICAKVVLKEGVSLHECRTRDL